MRAIERAAVLIVLAAFLALVVWFFLSLGGGVLNQG
jgi:hypothetical protein